MDRFDAMRVFTRVMERRSFSLAAEDLGLPRSTVTDAVKTLEARLGVRLLERTTRQVRPTLDGEAHYRRCLSLISDLEDAEGAFGGVDVLVNNAGIMKLAKIADSDDALFDQQIAINLKGSFNAMREAARRLRDGGRIINFSTSVVGSKVETYGVYAATKAAIETMTAILSKEMRGRSITVNAIAPGPVATDLFLTGKSPELIDRMSKMNPLERLGTPADIAASVSFLAGPEGGWINGQTLRANGGMV